jgi:hypothetical protein
VKRLGNRLHPARTKDESLQLFVLLGRPRRSWRPCHFPFAVSHAFRAIRLALYSGSVAYR